MTLFRFVGSSIKLRMNKFIILVLTVALSTAILSGALFLGDSVKMTILTLGKEKIGNSRYIVSSVNVNRMLPQIHEVRNNTGIRFVPILKLPARTLVNDSGLSIEHFNAYAVDESYFKNYHENYGIKRVENGEAVINEYLADQLNLKVNNIVQFRCGYFSNLSPSFSFYDNAQEFISQRFRISKVIPNRGPGRFSTTVNQGMEPLILFNLSDLQELLNVGRRVNLYLVGNTNDVSLVEDKISQAYTFSDLGYGVKKISNEWQIVTSDQLFITPEILKKFNKAVPESYPVFSYFINSVDYSNKSSPFHFIVGIDKEFLEKQYNTSLADNQAFISKWLAKDLEVNTNSELNIEYFTTTSNQKLENGKSVLRIKDIKSIVFFTSFKDLVLEFPGFSDTASCNDWDPSIPIDLNKVRDKDEEYWNDWEYTPKLLIAYSEAVKLWSTEYAAATGILIPASTKIDKLEKEITAKLNKAEMGYYIEDYIDRVSTSGNNSISFSELFIGLSFLLIIAAVFLLIFIVQIFYSARKDEIFILKATGFSRSKIIRIYLFEALMFTAPGIILGVLLGVAYNYFLMNGLTTVWFEAARLDTVLMNFTLKSILIGGISSLIINLIAAYLVIRNIISKIVIPVKPKKEVKKNSLLFYILSASFLVFLLVILAILHIVHVIESSVAFFFVAGGLLLLLFPILAIILVKLMLIKRLNSFSLKVFIFRSINLYLSRTVAIIFITSLSVFMIVSIGANKLITNTYNSQNGTGRYEISVSTAQAVSPQQTNYANSWQIPDSKVLSIRVKEGDEASCLNLNQVRNPRIAGINPRVLDSERRFKIVEEVQTGSGWKILDKNLKNKTIPAIADAGVLKWSLGLKIGDSLEIQAENGQSYSLIFMSALSSSVFQGSVLISEDNFMKLFPSTKGYNRFLIDLPDSANQKEYSGLLKRVLRPYGAVVRSNIDILDEYFSVQNTYISIFFQLGLMALVFAVVGISVLLLKKIQEEKNEISIQRVIGFNKREVVTQLFTENFVTIFYGIVSGAVSSIIALLPLFKEKTSLLLEYPLSAVIVISVCAAIFLSIFISVGLKTYNKMMPESR